MFHKGLNRALIVEAATALIEREGMGQFSMRRLAEGLQVKAASLYAHIDSMEALFTQVGLSALRAQKETLLDAVGEQRRDAAIHALAQGYRRFAQAHEQLYRLIMQMPSGEDVVLQDAAAMTAEPFKRVLAEYRLSDAQKMHWQRVLRGMMHGFVSEEQAGYFSHYPVSIEDSYRLAVDCVIDALHREEENNHGD